MPLTASKIVLKIKVEINSFRKCEQNYISGLIYFWFVILFLNLLFFMDFLFMSYFPLASFPSLFQLCFASNINVIRLTTVLATSSQVTVMGLLCWLGLTRFDSAPLHMTGLPTWKWHLAYHSTHEGPPCPFQNSMSCETQLMSVQDTREKVAFKCLCLQPNISGLSPESVFTVSDTIPASFWWLHRGVQQAVTVRLSDGWTSQ